MLGAATMGCCRDRGARANACAEGAAPSRGGATGVPFVPTCTKEPRVRSSAPAGSFCGRAPSTVSAASTTARHASYLLCVGASSAKNACGDPGQGLR